MLEGCTDRGLVKRPRLLLRVRRTVGTVSSAMGLSRVVSDRVMGTRGRERERERERLRLLFRILDGSQGVHRSVSRFELGGLSPSYCSVATSTRFEASVCTSIGIDAES